MMTHRRRTFLLGLLPAAMLFAQPAARPQRGNAALRYWMAFALMDNPTTDREMAERLERVADGREAWDESLAPVLDRNLEALATLRRGTEIEDCDWGLEEDLGPDAPIAHVPRGRALTRLNVIDGMRLARHGRTTDAVEAWLAGLRFSRHIASDRLWISALVAGRSLTVHLRALKSVVARGGLDVRSASKIEGEVATLPESGFDWAIAAGHEVDGLSRLFAALERAPAPLEAYETYFPLTEEDKKLSAEARARRLGLPVIQLASRESVRAAFRRARGRIEALDRELMAAFHLPPGEAAGILREIDARVAQDPILSRALPSSARLNEARAEVARERAALLDQLRELGRAQ